MQVKVSISICKADGHSKGFSLQNSLKSVRHSRRGIGHHPLEAIILECCVLQLPKAETVTADDAGALHSTPRFDKSEPMVIIDVGFGFPKSANFCVWLL